MIFKFSKVRKNEFEISIWQFYLTIVAYFKYIKTNETLRFKNINIFVK